jgi:hypothetical protein
MPSNSVVRFFEVYVKTAEMVTEKKTISELITMSTGSI